MDAFDQPDIAVESATRIASAQRPDPVALWTAIEADRRARDERTERLRAMRLIGGDEEAA